MSEHHSSRAIKIALLNNIVVTIAKLVGFILSGSSAMFAEFIHSSADTANQALLYVGIQRSKKMSDKVHRFGYGQETYFWNLISAVTIFFLGCVYTVNHAIMNIVHHNNEIDVSITAFVVLFLSFAAESMSWTVAFKSLKKDAENDNRSVVMHLRHARNPSVLAVLMEDSIALIGLTLALVGMGLSTYTGNTIFDGIAAIFIGLLMGTMAMVLARINKKYLINKSDEELDNKIINNWSDMPCVEKVHRVGSIVLSPDEVMVMAEIELSEEHLKQHMSQEEIDRTIAFMRKINHVKTMIETSASQTDGRCKNNIFIEFVESPEKVV